MWSRSFGNMTDRVEEKTATQALVACQSCDQPNPRLAEYCLSCWAALVTPGSDVQPTRIKLKHDDDLSKFWEKQGTRSGFIDRTEELAQLTEILEDVLTQRAPRLITVTGGAGLGKTRILDEFLRYLESSHPEIRILKTTCGDHETGSYDFPIRSLLRKLCDIKASRGGSNTDDLVARMARELFPREWSDQHATVLSSLVGLAPSEESLLRDSGEIEKGAAVDRLRRLNLITRIFEHSGQKATLIVFVDNLERANQETRTLDVLLEVNLSGEASKYGFDLSGWPGDDGQAKTFFDEVERILTLPAIRLQGVMTMPPFTLNPEEVRPIFKRAKALRRALQERFDGQACPHLSMGMSGDFEVAIEEGATMVRLGTVLFGSRL